MAVRLVEESEVEQARTALSAMGVVSEPGAVEVTTPARPPGPSREAIMMELITTASRILGYRVQLFFAFLGSLALGGYAAHEASWLPLVVAGVYNLMVLAPMIFLAYRRG